MKIQTPPVWDQCFSFQRTQIKFGIEYQIKKEDEKDTNRCIDGIGSLFGTIRKYKTSKKIHYMYLLNIHILLQLIKLSDEKLVDGALLKSEYKFSSAQRKRSTNTANKQRLNGTKANFSFVISLLKDSFLALDFGSQLGVVKASNACDCFFD